MYLCVLCIVCSVLFPVLFVCTCVLNNCHWVATQLQLNISIHIEFKIRNVALDVCRMCPFVLLVKFYWGLPTCLGSGQIMAWG
jgi:hypothetical protein